MSSLLDLASIAVSIYTNFEERRRPVSVQIRNLADRQTLLAQVSGNYCLPFLQNTVNHSVATLYDMIQLYLGAGSICMVV